MQTPPRTFSWDIEDKLLQSHWKGELSLMKWSKLKWVEGGEAQLNMALMILGSKGKIIK